MTRPFAQRLDLSEVDDQFRTRFWSKVHIAGPDDCWEWKAYRKPSGYGQFMLRKGFFITASRVALALTTGPLEPGLVACHRCDNPPCCNPRHLFAGTQVDNGLDSVAKGRANRVRGEASPWARLTASDVLHIRTHDPSMTAELAREFGVSWTTINKVFERRTWRHVA